MPTVLTNPNNQLLLGIVLGLVGVYLLLPQPRRRAVAAGTFCCIAAVGVISLFLAQAFGRPLNSLIGDILFWFFATSAVGFGIAMVTQRNPGRGAIAFAFTILSTCGLFLLLAAPFIMAATIIIYAGAIIVTFLFLLMLSHVAGPSDENDRSREPLMGSLAGFAFIGLILFTLHQAKLAEATTSLPSVPLTSVDQADQKSDRTNLASAVANINEALKAETLDAFREKMKPAHDSIGVALGDDSQPLPGTAPPVLARRLRLPKDPRHIELLQSAKKLAKANDEAENKTLGKDLAAAKDAAAKLRDETILFAGHGQLPARNVANLGYMLYSEHILAVEMAGTLLLVATIGAVAIAGRRREVAA